MPPQTLPHVAHARPTRRARLALGLTALVSLVAPALIGCGGNVVVPVGTNPGTPVANYKYLTGNWVITATSTAGTSPFSTLMGFINEESQEPGTYDLTTAALQVTPSASSCYDSAIIVPFNGATEGTAIKLGSLSDNGQYITIAATKNSTATAFTGTYTISGGCAKGDAGTLAGTQYTALTGTYAATGLTSAIPGSTGSQGISLALSQYVQGTGSGTFLVSGTATFTGSACFTSGTMAATAGYVLGNTAVLTFTTNGASTPDAILTGTFDVAADTLTLNSFQVTGGSCAGTSTATTALTKS